MQTLKTMFLGLFLLGLLFTACEQEAIVTEEVVEATELEMAQEYLSNERNLILFTALQVDYDNYKVTGFLVDKFGSLRTVETTGGIIKELGNTYISDLVMRDLYSRSVLTKELPVIDVSNAAKLAKRLAKEKAKEDKSLNTTTLYLSFARNNAYQTQASCGPGQFDNGPTHRQLMIAAEGRFEGLNSSDAAVEILSWLQELEQAN